MEDGVQPRGAVMLTAFVVLIALALIAAGFVLFGGKDEASPQEPVTVGDVAQAKKSVGDKPFPEPIRIGFIGPLTGDKAEMGQNAQAAVALAVQEINAAGGVNGRRLEVIYEDGKCSGADAAKAADKLITADKVPVILGGACSEETLAFAEAAEQSKTVVLSYCSSAPALTEAGDYIFRNYPSDIFQGVFAADHFFETLGKRKAAVLYEQSDWGVGVKDAFILHFTNLGSPVIVSEEGYEPTARDLRKNLLNIKTAQPEAVYFLGRAEASISGIKQAKEIGLEAQIFGGDRWDDARIWREVGSAGNGVSYAVVSAPPREQFRARMKTQTGSDEIAACSPTAYDGLKILAQVMRQVGVVSEAIKNELYQTVYTDGVSSPKIGFDGNGDLVGAYYAVKAVKDGKAEVLK